MEPKIRMQISPERRTPRGTITHYTEAALAVRAAAVGVWAAVRDAGAPTPGPGGLEDWVRDDRHRARARACVMGFPTPAVKAAERAYQRTLDACIKTNYGLILKICGRLKKKAARVGLEMEDLVQEGAIGMQRALETYDPTQKTSFSTYAFYWVYQAADRAIANAGTVRVPIRAQQSAENGTGKRANVRSLYDPVSPQHTSDGITIGDTLTDPGPTPEEISRTRQDTDRLTAALEGLSPMEQEVIAARFLRGETLEQIGEARYLTRERIRQIEKQALDKLACARVHFNSDGRE